MTKKRQLKYNINTNNNIEKRLTEFKGMYIYEFKRNETLVK